MSAALAIGALAGILFLAGRTMHRIVRQRRRT
jgi:hypothetical protein